MRTGISLNNEQSIAIKEIVFNRENVFVSGAGGTGKSYIISLIRRFMKNVIVCAPTGMAALNVGGETIHSIFKLPCRALGPNEQIEDMLTTVVEKSEVIVIDEVSMVRRDIFSTIIKIINYAEEKTEKKKQIVAFGDFFQLPPVITNDDKGVIKDAWKQDVEKGFCFETEEWKRCNFKFVELVKSVRHNNDEEFERNLTLLREGDTRCIEYFNNKSNMVENKAITLCGKKVTADRINNEQMEKNSNPSKTYMAIIEGMYPKNRRMTDDYLTLKIGMKVMTLCNDFDGYYKNGSRGTVVGLGENEVKVKFDDGNCAYVYPYKWEMKKSKVSGEDIIEEKIGAFTQIPLRCAYAITIHKAQGMTLDKANIFPDIFEVGMLYVALGRCKSIKDIHLKEKIQEEHVKVSKEVVDFYEQMREEVA